ncbi:hypothetical protein PPERSA_02580 [Pseudocohnilembus persalinus]|uniref:Fe2OG dioxygenase domain-containing protein n=1 Tax=Pseudocohnilembus persalinus TaxID=266149 RepID=A0A0V0R5G4_PSEPJ|nr:hypothetical protein PPERSA_02580 [Pseudocohnilembus persalinus]|eukprot:KRX09708.1 hypothetical protein PPERSA_02580 [Pseudocohnilembus persalinus]
MAQKKQIAQHFFQFGEKKYIKPHIFEVDLYDHERRKNSKELDYIHEIGGLQFVQAAQNAFKNLNLSFSPSAIKMQYNEGGGGCFPWHYDNAGNPSKRQLTCVIYLNPEWKEGDGGEIVVWPFLEQPVKIAPKMDRAVLFRSDMVLHRVMPSKKERFCFSIWCDGNEVNKPQDTQLTSDKLQFTSWDQAFDFFKNSPLQRVLSRAVYKEEYEQSLLECVGNTEAENPMLNSHHANCQQIEKQLKPLITQLRANKFGGEEKQKLEYIEIN